MEYSYYLMLELFILLFADDIVFLSDTIVGLQNQLDVLARNCARLFLEGGGTFFNASLLQTYIHGAPEDMRHWYSQHFISHKHGMNKHTGKREVDESIISLQKKVCKAPTSKRNLYMSSSS